VISNPLAYEDGTDTVFRNVASYPLAYEDGTECSETTAIIHHRPGNNPKDYTQYIEHGESLKSRKGLYMFLALLVDPQEALHKRHLVYCVRVMSVGCDTVLVLVVQKAEYAPRPD
jgi:hypothetical protein